MKKLIFFILSLLIIIAAMLFYIKKHKPIILVNNEVTIVKHTTDGARARITELEKEGKGIYEIVDTLEDEGYIRELNK